jgi:hypothetical protein
VEERQDKDRVAVREELRHDPGQMPFVPRPGAFDPEQDLRCAFKPLHVPADATARERGQGEAIAQERQSRDPAAGAAGSPIDPETFRPRSVTSSISIHPELIWRAFQVWWQQLRAKHPIPIPNSAVKRHGADGTASQDVGE